MHIMVAIAITLFLTGCTLLGGLTDDQRSTFKDATTGVSEEKEYTVEIINGEEEFKYQVDGDDIMMNGIVEEKEVQMGYINEKNYVWVDGQCATIPASENDLSNWQEDSGMDFSYTDDEIDSAVTFDGEEKVDDVDTYRYKIAIEGGGEDTIWISKSDSKLIKAASTAENGGDFFITFTYEKPEIEEPTDCIG